MRHFAYLKVLFCENITIYYNLGTTRIYSVHEPVKGLKM